MNTQNPEEWWAERCAHIAELMRNTGVAELIIRRKGDGKYMFELTPEPAAECEASERPANADGSSSLNYLTTMNTPTTPQARVSKITVGRLHNLGNYEHVRYEIAVDIPEGASATQALSNVERVLAGLDPKPPVSDYDLQRAAEALKKPVEDWPEWEQINLECYGNYIAKDAAWRAEQKLAREALDDIGGTRIYTDAKEKWDDGY